MLHPWHSCQFSTERTFERGFLRVRRYPLHIDDFTANGEEVPKLPCSVLPDAGGLAIGEVVDADVDSDDRHLVKSIQRGRRKLSHSIGLPEELIGD
ncbi:hypothetical protein SAMN05444422_10132 [Halobiforma haloterrestris]|uniref:Uncharacterized protein n=1 Tax=Natronobacterium haloterrestre TaxID=148448 RepID=A0A1I1D2Q2_NATHA|nr:hypothetical protein SAMN05444422_10132 [Halobiforma haloterrestris]